MNPWLETWTLSDVDKDEPNAGFDLRMSGPGGFETASILDGGRARLSASAPQLVRALLAVEWAAEFSGYEHCCPSCVIELGDDHTPDCRLDAALTAAGLATQEERDEARKATQFLADPSAPKAPDAPERFEIRKDALGRLFTTASVTPLDVPLVRADRFDEAVRNIKALLAATPTSRYEAIAFLAERSGSGQGRDVK